jgi:transcriptional regulator with XRE-family HTH domain
MQKGKDSSNACGKGQPLETPRERMQRLYAAPGGPLIGRLRNEAQKRGHNPQEMATSLGVTAGYVEQLAAGIRPIDGIQQEFADNCSRYLNVPTIVVKLLSGNIRMSDFLQRFETEEEVTDRAIRQIQLDPQLSEALPADLAALPFEAKKAIALMYAEVTSSNLFGLRELPETVYWLQRAALNVEDALSNADEA